MSAWRSVAALSAVLISAVGCAATPPPRMAVQPMVLQPLPPPEEPPLPPFKSAPPYTPQVESNPDTATRASAPAPAPVSPPRPPPRPAEPGAAVPLEGFRPMRSAPRPADNGI